MQRKRGAPPQALRHKIRPPYIRSGELPKNFTSDGSKYSKVLARKARKKTERKEHMGDSKRSYSRGDRAALTIFSAGKCYWPGCNESLLKEVEGVYRIALEIAHTCAANPNGERYVPEMTDDERKSFHNLIFLCIPHHKTIDEAGAESKFPIELLRQWKAEREAGAPERLRGLQDVTEEKLVTMISSAVKQRDADIKRTLERLENTDTEAAELIQELRDEILSLRRNSSLIDPDVAIVLDRAASNLLGLEDHAAALNRAADHLVHLEDRAAQIQRAAQDLRAAAMRAEDLGRFY